MQGITFQVHNSGKRCNKCESSVVEVSTNGTEMEIYCLHCYHAEVKSIKDISSFRPSSYYIEEKS